MAKFIDLTHVFEKGMPGFRMKDKSGQITEFTAKISTFLTHTESKSNYQGKATFEITHAAFQTSWGTYLDAPRHRYEGAPDIASLDPSSLISPEIVVDGRHCNPERPLSVADLPKAELLEGWAVLINFGWDKHWASESYFNYPYVD